MQPGTYVFQAKADVIPTGAGDWLTCRIRDVATVPVAPVDVISLMAIPAGEHTINLVGARTVTAAGPVKLECLDKSTDVTLSNARLVAIAVGGLGQNS